MPSQAPATARKIEYVVPQVLTKDVLAHGSTPAPPSESMRASYAAGEAVPWVIQNKYYTAEVYMDYVDCMHATSKAPAMILLVSRDAPVGDHVRFLQEAKQKQVVGFELDVSVVVGVPGAQNAQGVRRSEEIDRVYAMEGWEYIDLMHDEEGAPGARLRDALMSHTWDGMEVLGQHVQVHEAHDAFPVHAGSPAEESFDDDFLDFASAPAPGEVLPSEHDVDMYAQRLGLQDKLEDMSTVPFDRLHLEMQRVRALPQGAEKEAQAALVALALDKVLKM
ncbi:hypothetical protein MVES1_001240 [Malassezia vespertilionis]|uniref:uncharacterized protein n=1 Tax=Malassezia vespertilionis TaxID=2020962 RepID=UPI0024B200B8|nr:uncharacterized protein MVES1_001240 [Malassezia vespertilionis]WFD05906.1 hypothetical protein MVES1_001240 [Malassezia vespertilionis]